MSIVAMALGLMAAQPPAPAGIAYVPIGGPRAGMMRAVEATLPASAPAGTRPRRARFDAGAMERCIDDRAVADAVDRCLRRLVPADERGAPVVALYVDEDRISNVTGSRVHLRHTLKCIGRRSIATAALGDRGIGAQLVMSPGMHEEVRMCLATAMTARNAGLLREPRGGPPRWLLPVANYLPDNAAIARGQGSEEAIVTIEALQRTPGDDRRCLIRGRVTEEEAYFFLRTGDIIEARVPCTDGGQAGFLRAIAPAGLRRGSRARMHVDADGGLLFVEPL